MYFKKNHNCEICKLPFDIVWNCKLTSEDKYWVLLCYNCVRYFKHLNLWRFKTQLQNIKNIRRCSLGPIETLLPLHEVNK